MAIGPCMCGDLECWSCGPAQGNFHCPVCGKWATSGCEHLVEETGELKPEFRAQAEENARLEYEAEEAMAQSYRDDAEMAARHAEELAQWARGLGGTR